MAGRDKEGKVIRDTKGGKIGRGGGSKENER